mmetsp:Transcript_12388/g.31275  ORF Transcript_12388/g.31275 Transcript_12388/m.31275 type:complete len:234 (-) Transcript_12388:1115-1816(-)
MATLQVEGKTGAHRMPYSPNLSGIMCKYLHTSCSCATSPRNQLFYINRALVVPAIIQTHPSYSSPSTAFGLGINFGSSVVDFSDLGSAALGEIILKRVAPLEGTASIDAGWNSTGASSGKDQLGTSVRRGFLTGLERKGMGSGSSSNSGRITGLERRGGARSADSSSLSSKTAGAANVLGMLGFDELATSSLIFSMAGLARSSGIAFTTGFDSVLGAFMRTLGFDLSSGSFSI